MIWTLTHILLIAVILAGFLSFSLLLGLLAALRKSCRSGEDAGPYLDAGYTVQKGSIPPNSHQSHQSPADVSLRRQCGWCGTILRPGSPGAATTTTICPKCMPIYFPETKLNEKLTA